MISTIETRESQLRNGYFQSGTGPLEILILGSCRTLAYLNYLIRYNESKNQMTIRRIDPCDWHWNEQGQPAYVEEVLTRCEADERILSVLRSCDIFIHEHIASYGMFNTSRDAEKNIYQYGMAAPIDISIPNWHDHFILWNDFADFNAATDDWSKKGEAEIEKFCNVARMSSFPEMGDYVRDNWRTIRFFWRPNHVSAAFTSKIFELMNKKFLYLDIDGWMWDAIRAEDQFRDPHTEVHARDREAYGITWQ